AGFSTRLFSLYFEKVISVDPYLADYDSGDANSNSSRLTLARDLFRIRFSDDPRVNQVNKNSEEVASEFRDNSIDLIYIDGDHTYEGVKKDIQAWISKVKLG
ncbi:class I SAM-dependent methyltransferase, partial [Halomonas sp. SIMBA_159]